MLAHLASTSSLGTFLDLGGLILLEMSIMQQNYIQLYCRTFQTFTAYKIVLYKVDEGARYQNILQSVVIDSTMYVYAQDQFILIKSVAMTLYNIVWVHNPDCENSAGMYAFLLVKVANSTNSTQC